MMKRELGELDKDDEDIIQSCVRFDIASNVIRRNCGGGLTRSLTDSF